MRTERAFWAALLLISLGYIAIFLYFFIGLLFPFHVDQMKKRAGETVHHLQATLPYLDPAVRQAYLQGLAREAEDLSYLLLMDEEAYALAHSDPQRIGMRFDEPGFRRCLTTGTRIEQIYHRDADQPSSPYFNEKTIDILEPYRTADGKIAGVVNVGISLAAIETIKSKYIIVSAIAIVFWLAFISAFAISHLRTQAAKRRADQALSDSERRLSQAIAATSDAIWEWDLSSGRTYYNPRWYEMLGYADQEFAMTVDNWRKLCHPDDLQTIRELVQEAIVSRGNLGHEAELRMRHKNGEWRWILGRGKVVSFDGGKPQKLCGTNTDITERKKNEERLRESEERYRRIIENIPDVLYRTDGDGNLTFISPSGVRLLGYDSEAEMLGRPNEFFWANPAERAAMLATLKKNGSTRDHEVLLKRRDGSEILVSTSSSYYRDQQGTILGIEGLCRDISERKRAEKQAKELQEQLLQAQKMEAVGRLAGGVAHDFNNMLVVIMGRAEMALMKIPASHPLHVDLTEISQAAERSANLTKHLLAFARKQTVSPKILDLNLTIEKMLSMHRRLIGEHIELEWLPGKGLPPVKIDPTQIDQILVNLSVNARDAISGVGKITIQTGTARLDAANCAKHAGLTPGEYVMLAVSDNGCGIDKNILDHIFEPFFTTKEAGRGTGIGLATVFGIVKQNEGAVTVDSAPGKGTTFTIYLPGLRNAIPLSQIPVTLEPLKGHGETILLVEDEPAIIELGRVMLEALNYHVLPAATPEEAINLARDHDGPIHLLITDVMMPQMNGRDLAVRIGELRKDIGCLFMSGYTADIIGQRGVLADNINFMQKPFTMQLLANKVSDTLIGSAVQGS